MDGQIFFPPPPKQPQPQPQHDNTTRLSSENMKEHIYLNCRERYQDVVRSYTKNLRNKTNNDCQLATVSCTRITQENKGADDTIETIHLSEAAERWQWPPSKNHSKLVVPSLPIR